jgi:HSP20 family protein
MKLATTTPTLASVVKDDFDRLVDRMFSAPLFGMPTAESVTGWTPNLDFSETDKEYVVRVEACGVPKDDIDVNLEGQVLTVSGRRHFEHEEKSEEFFWRERESGRFVRSVRLPSAVKTENVEARCADGLITIRIPKAETAVKSRIMVK